MRSHPPIESFVIFILRLYGERASQPGLVRSHCTRGGISLGWDENFHINTGRWDEAGRWDEIVSCTQAHVLVHAFKMADHSEQEAGRWDEKLEGGMKLFI